MGHTDVNGQGNKPRTRIILAGNVYDVTNFVQWHPGGREHLERNNGQNVQAVMQTPDIHVHSKAAYSILEKYFVGAVNSLDLENENYLKVDTITKTEEYYQNDIVDWSKPMLGQVELLGDKYFDWTHQQVDRPLRLFHSDLAEMMTKAHWWFVPVTWIPIGLYYLYISFRILFRAPEVWPPNALGCQLGPTSMLFFFVFGLLLWTLLEYAIHRWLFHHHPPLNWPFLIRLHFALHGLHHKSPMDPLRLVFPPLPAAIIGVLIFVGCMSLFPKGVASAVFAGITIGYVVYDVTHFYIHHGQPTMPYFRRLKTYHVHHHYKHQQLGFGISSKLWDYPFGTLIPDDKAMLKNK